MSRRKGKGRPNSTYCHIHGHTDDMLVVGYKHGRAEYACRLCNTKPCDIHGWDYVTRITLGGEERQVCVVCEPTALMEAADERNGTRQVRYG